MKKIYIGMLLVLLLTSVCLGACGKREVSFFDSYYPRNPGSE